LPSEPRVSASISFFDEEIKPKNLKTQLHSESGFKRLFFFKSVIKAVPRLQLAQRELKVRRLCNNIRHRHRGRGGLRRDWKRTRVWKCARFISILLRFP
jgi:hypothetical protein